MRILLAGTSSGCGKTTAGFAHLHFLSHPEWMERLWR